MKRLFAIILCTLLWMGAKSQEYPFQNTSLRISQRAEDLLNRLTMEEKLSLMEHQNPAIERLGIKPYSWWNEALHGVGRNGTATVWPMPIALAATFNPYMVNQVFAQVAAEAHKKHQESQAQESYGDYTGLTFFTPNINIFRDPRWGRGMETYGEDPYLTAIMGLMCVNGLQHSFMFNARYDQLTAAACLKHLAVHSGPEGVRHEFDSKVTPRDLWSTYLPAFEYIIKNSDVQQVMCGYNRMNGSPCCTNKELLVDILRNRWGYKGLLVTDCWALNDCWERDTIIPRHKTHPTAALAAADAFGGEVDLECGSGLNALRVAVDSGYISKQQIDKHVRRIIETRMRVEEKLTPHNTSSDMLCTPSDVAASTLVLLKNKKNLLPLTKGTRVKLVGPNANDTLMPLGNYNGTPEHTYTIEEGLQMCDRISIDSTQYDVIVYAGGLNPQLEGEELPVDMPGFYKGDRTLIELPQAQINEIKKLKKSGKPIVLLLCTGSAIALEPILKDVDAIMVCWYGGQEMGLAVADALCGKRNSFGRLPITFYRNTEQLPDFADYNMSGRTYRYMTERPLFPFGYGLSYNKTTFKDLTFDEKTLTLKGTIISSKHSCDAGVPDNVIVEIYLKNTDDPQGPQKSLVGIIPAGVNEGTPEKFEFKLDPFWMRVFDNNKQEMTEPKKGTHYVLQVGTSSDDKDLKNIKFQY